MISGASGGLGTMVQSVNKNHPHQQIQDHELLDGLEQNPPGFHREPRTGNKQTHGTGTPNASLLSWTLGAKPGRKRCVSIGFLNMMPRF